MGRGSAAPQGCAEAARLAAGDDLAPAAVESAAFTESDVRAKFLRKLAYNKVWEPDARRLPTHQSVSIFDWDDTLLPTSWLGQHEHLLRGSELEDQLQTIVQHSRQMLQTALDAGHTYIITNAIPGWVEQSATLWAPELLPILRKVQIISARDKFEATYPHDVRQWKINAFRELRHQLDATKVTSLVALGDADYEMDAARIMGDEFEQGLVKTVKFRPYPDLEEHLMQVDAVDRNLALIIGSARKLHVCLDRTRH